MGRHVLLSILSLASLAIACSHPQVQDNNDASESGPDTSNDAASLSLVPSSTITLTPRGSIEVFATVEPQDTYAVRFLLLGNSLDASLDASKRITSPNGKTSVRLLAPASPTAFRLNATAGGTATAEVAVSVSNQGFADARVSPSYKGIRSTPTWTASARADASCTDIPGQPPQDGPIVGTAKGDNPVALDSLPVGPAIAITLRSQNAVGGCTEIVDLSPNETRELVVKVSDMPVQFADTSLHLAMVADPSDSAMLPLLEELTTSFVETLFPRDRNEALVLLDAIESRHPEPTEFSEARLTGGWDDLLSAWLDQADQSLADHIRSWVSVGLDPLRSGEVLVGKLNAVPGSITLGTLSLTRFHGLPISPLGVPTDHIVSFSIDPGDMTRIGGKVTWLPTKLIGAAADMGAHESDLMPNAVHALTRIVGCDELGSLLSATTPLPTLCDEWCLASTCESALASMWTQARNQSSASFDTVQTSFTISGTATVDGNATIVAMDAIWIGTQVHDGNETPVRGTAVGSVHALSSI